MKRAVTVTVLAVMACVLGYAVIAAPGTVALRSNCHSTAITLKSKDTVKARKLLSVTVTTGEGLKHGFWVTLQYRKASSSTWRASGSTILMTQKPWAMSWRAPKATGKYKLRVKVEYAGEGANEVTYSRVKTVRVTN